MGKSTTAVITYKRNDAMTTGFDCRCGYTYTIPPTMKDVAHAGNLVDCMVRYHENKHKHGKI